MKKGVVKNPKGYAEAFLVESPAQCFLEFNSKRIREWLDQIEKDVKRGDLDEAILGLHNLRQWVDLSIGDLSEDKEKI